jgi:hypothetical protein
VGSGRFPFRILFNCFQGERYRYGLVAQSAFWETVGNRNYLFPARGERFVVLFEAAQNRLLKTLRVFGRIFTKCGSISRALALQSLLSSALQRAKPSGKARRHAEDWVREREWPGVRVPPSPFFIGLRFSALGFASGKMDGKRPDATGSPFFLFFGFYPVVGHVSIADADGNSPFLPYRNT